MNIRIYSDIHNEIHRGHYYEIKELENDHDTVLVLAGDIDFFRDGIMYANSMSKRFKAIIYVPGNHEYYKRDKLGCSGAFLVKHNVYVLDDDSVIIDGIMFIGSTLWSDIQEMQKCIVSQSLVDFQRIRLGESSDFRKLTVNDCIRMHNLAKLFINKELSNSYMNKVVITHYAPSWKSSTPNRVSSNIGSAYYSDCESLVTKCDLWIHGHTHDCVDYNIGNARVVANCRGYHTYYGDECIAMEDTYGKFDEYGLNIHV